ncbi:MAG: glycosyltransferase family 2 protein [bacterium]|nr:glycosyltransferase family 2 protein [bacterium]
MNKLTVVILTRNEEKRIKNTIKSLAFCNEIIVVDDESTDKTCDIAKKGKALIFIRPLKNDFANQRNFALEKASNEWVLFIDADEEVSKELQKEIVDSIQKTEASSYALKRRDFWMNKELKYGETRKTREQGIVRLVKKDSGIWMGNVHEVFHTAKSVSILHNYLNHYPHPTVAEFIQDVNFYSTLRAKELFNNSKKTNIFEIITYPFFKFVLTYFIYLGLLDGVPGFTYSFFMSFHSFLVRSKLYQYWNIKSP